MQAYALIEGDLVIAKDDGGLYMRSDVHALLTKIRGEIVHNSGLRTEFQDFNDVIEVIDSALMDRAAPKASGDT